MWLHVVVIIYFCIVILFYEYSTIYLLIGLLVTFGLLGLFHLGAIKNDAAMNIFVPVFSV